MKREFKFIILFFIILPVLYLIFYLLIPFLWIKTDEAFHKGRYDRAIDYLSFISYIQPKNSESYIIKAWLQWSIAKSLQNEGLPYEKILNQAVETYKKGQKNSPKNWKIYYEEGMMWEAFGKEEEAKKLYSISFKLGCPRKNKAVKVNIE